MSNEIQQYAPAELVPSGDLPDVSDKALERIEKQARTMAAAHKLGSALAKTAMVPEIYQQFPENKKENPQAADNATAAILYGAELGLSAVQSLQNIFIVRGKPAVYGRTMVAQVLAAGHLVEEVEASPESVTWRGQRAGSATVHTSTWTIDRAKQAGFLSNKLYTTMPTEMLRAKCQSEICKTTASDVLLGMAHSVEDLQLATPVVQATAERVPAGPKRGTAGLAERLGVTSNEDAKPEPEQVSEPAGEPAKAERKATADQIKTLGALLDKEKRVTPEEKLEYIQAQFGDDVKDPRQLPYDSVDALIKFLESEQAADAAKAAE